MQPIRKERGESHSTTWIPVSPPRSTPRLKSALWRQRLPSAQRLRTEFLKRVAHRPTREERGESRSAACSCAAQSETRLGGWVPRSICKYDANKLESKARIFQSCEFHKPHLEIQPIWSVVLPPMFSMTIQNSAELIEHLYQLCSNLAFRTEQISP